MEYLPKRLRRVVPLRLFSWISRKILGVSGAKTLMSWITGKSVGLSDEKRARVKFGRRVGRLQKIIRALKRYARGHHLSPDFLLLFKYTYEIGSLGCLHKGRDKGLKLRRQLLILKEELVRYIVDVIAYSVPYYGLYVLGRRLTTLHIVEWISLVGEEA